MLSVTTRRKLLAMCAALGFAALGPIPVLALPTTAPTPGADGATAPVSITDAAMEFVYTDKGSLPALPPPMRVLLPNMGATTGMMQLDQRGLPTGTLLGACGYVRTSPTAGQLTSGPMGAPAEKMDVDNLTFTSPEGGTFFNGTTQARGTFKIMYNAMQNPRGLMQRFGQQGAPVGRRSPLPAAPSTEAVANVPPVQSLEPAVKRPRAPGAKDHISMERQFNALFQGPVESLSPASLAFLYESRVATPDYMMLGILTFEDFKLAGNDEFRKQRLLRNNADAIEAKLDRAAGRRIVMFGFQRPKVTYDFTAGGFRCFELAPTVLRFGPRYGCVVTNLEEAQFFKISEDKAETGIVSAGGRNPVYDFNVFAVVEGLGAPTAQVPKVVAVRVVGISLTVGKAFKGLYRVDKGTLQDWQNPDKDFADVK